jgi:hypothetical protein
VTPSRSQPRPVRRPGRLERQTYEVVQRAHAALVRRRHGGAFAGVRAFVLFVGYPRSGHSIVGAMLNAHRHAVVSHELAAQRLILAGVSREELFSRVVARAEWFHLRGNRTNYSYAIPTGWQGRFEELRVLGDKRGGDVTRALAEHPDFLDRVRRLVGVPLRLVHVVRNPFDNIAAISIWHHLPLEEAARWYFELCETTSRLDALCGPEELFALRHEELIRAPADALRRLCGFAGLDAPADYVAVCASVVFAAPTATARRVRWPDGLVARVGREIGRRPLLAGYDEPPL